MRRQFALAFGGIMAAAAVGTAQPPAQPKKADTFVRPVNSTQMLPPVEAAPVGEAVETLPPVRSMTRVTPQAAAPASGYAPIQPVQTYTIGTQMPAAGQASGPVQYIPVQPAGQAPVQPQVAPMVPAMTPAVQYVPIQAVTGQPTVGTGGLLMSTPTMARPAQAPVAQTSCPTNACPNVAPASNCPNVVTQCGATAAANGQAPCGSACEAANQPCCKAPCGPAGRIWGSAEYLLWWTRGMYVPPLVTGSTPGTPRELAGVLGDSRTRVLFGDSELNDGVRSGFRLRLGGWLDNCQTCGIEGSYFFLGDANDTYAANCTDSLVLARPFTNVNPNGGEFNDSELICLPGVIDGRIVIESGTSFQGFDANIRKNLSCDCCNRVDGLVGFRYLQLDDNLDITEDINVIGTDPVTPIAVGTRFQVRDSFRTRNEFYGGQVGLTGEHRRSGGWYVNWRALVALGTNHKEVTIDGSTLITPPGGAPMPGGLLALPTNIGRYTRNDFAVVPEFGVNLGYQVSDNVRVFAGYTFLYWSNVTRPGDVIDTTINTSQLPPGTLVGPARPAFTWNDDTFWAQGVSFGAEVRY